MNDDANNMICADGPPLGFPYDACEFTTTSGTDVRHACFRVRKILEGIVYDTVALEGNPFTLPEVKTLIEGITVGRQKSAMQSRY